MTFQSPVNLKTHELYFEVIRTIGIIGVTSDFLSFILRIKRCEISVKGKSNNMTTVLEYMKWFVFMRKYMDIFQCYDCNSIS